MASFRILFKRILVRNEHVGEALRFSGQEVGM